MGKTSVTEADILGALKAAYKAPAWALFTHLRNGTGWARSTTRTADALAMSLWPSHGLEVLGFEVKVSKSDLARELKEPEKAEDIARFCDRWWLVVPPGIVDLPTLPPAWGVMEVTGLRRKVVREAQKLEAQPLDRVFVAALLRQVHKGADARSEFESRDRVKEAVEFASKAHGLEVLSMHKELTELKAKVEMFRSKSGIDINWLSDSETFDHVRDVDRARQLEGLALTAAKVLARDVEHAATNTKRLLVEALERHAKAEASAAAPCARLDGADYG